jgi:phytanoyl-CoA hydroxylase
MAAIDHSVPDVLPSDSPAIRLTDDEIARFWRDGYLCVRGLATRDDVDQMRRVTELGLRDHVGPIEYEADLQYPGAPQSLDAVGGRTVRRLKQALSRDFLFTEWMMRPSVLGRLQQLLGPEVVCPLAHHNCIMTKQPEFSSETGWHQDIRYWSYAKPSLINAWIALGCEQIANGCLQVIPGSHVVEFHRTQFDADVFFRPDLPENQPWIQTRQYVELNPGDVLFFHCKTLHAAGRNTTSESKLSAVFTFRGGDNFPLPGSRSSALPELLLTPGRLTTG